MRKKIILMVWRRFFILMRMSSVSALYVAFMLGSSAVASDSKSKQLATDVQCYSDAKAAYGAILAEDAQDEAIRHQSVDNAVVNLNTASEGELASLAGIGSSKAQEIILYREMFGNFTYVDQLARVKGIGKKTVEKNRHRLRVR